MRAKTGRALISGLFALVVTACGGREQNLEGEALAAEIGCLACHGEASTDVAPTLHGLWGSEVTLDDGRTLIVDEDYVRMSITQPQADIVAGYDGRMPTFTLSDSEVDRLIEYVRSLG
jgi:cytochrome c oxidase subunit 2